MFGLKQRLFSSQLFWLTLAVLLSTIVMKLIDNQLVTSQAPAGIISFELAGSIDKVTAIISSWDESTRRLAAFLLGLDYLYLIIYSWFLFLVARRMQQTVISKSNKLFRNIPLFAICAGICDFIENIFTIKLVLSLPNIKHEMDSSLNSAVELMQLFATFKFMFLALVFLHIVYCLIRYAQSHWKC